MKETNYKRVAEIVEESILEEAAMALNQKELLKTVQLFKAKTSQEAGEDDVFSPKEVQKYVNHLTSLVPQWAEKGYTYIEYDCSALPKDVTKQIAEMFKIQNPEIFVISDLDRRFVICDWSGKNEV